MLESAHTTNVTAFLALALVLLRFIQTFLPSDIYLYLYLIGSPFCFFFLSSALSLFHLTLRSFPSVQRCPWPGLVLLSFCKFIVIHNEANAVFLFRLFLRGFNKLREVSRGFRVTVSDRLSSLSISCSPCPTSPPSLYLFTLINAESFAASDVCS